MAAIANTFAMDPFTQEALMRLQPKRYVGLVVWSGMQPEYAEGAQEGDPPLRHLEVLAPLFVASGPPPIPEAKDMYLPIDPSPPSRTQEKPQSHSVVVTDEDSAMTVDGVFDMEDEFPEQDVQESDQGQASDCHDAMMDEDDGQSAHNPEESSQALDEFGPLSAIRHPSLLPLRGRVQWLTFGTRLHITTFHESSLSFYVDDDEDQPPYEWRRFEALVTDNLAALFDRSSSPPDADGTSAGSGDESDALVQKLRVPDISLPAIVWRDIRGEHEDDPTEFVRELDRIHDILGELRQP
ncbi:hypothetical protein BD309DRAFT_989498 [Dichomitus squalens]|uniref:uncharacterized protein n=1 Tax=Dichomitus squalens (strain LYAD-421) TaxID=732165 RepID=UPI0004413D09|nr:uncharacterized protein DICSQDRAFT_134702 [Dichomitus squalens LYAD-421 SS1]EJF63271.1 hypothetical protein DICSQDRAFT_134702 [Dichomitus squalens LYAD-421 SS1]TBU45520.1 hypothetical protein BD309DRAFT_989498 [Dichomitus squalens]